MIVYFKNIHFSSGLCSNAIHATVVSENGLSFNAGFPFFAFSNDFNKKANNMEGALRSINMLRAAMKCPNGFMVEINSESFDFDVSEIWSPTENEIRLYKMKFMAAKGMKL